MLDTGEMNECDTGVGRVAELKRMTSRGLDRDLVPFWELKWQVRWTSGG